MTKPITIFTFDGTASAGANVPSNPGGSPEGWPSNVGGGYPAELADRLTKADPTVWNWVPVDYVPNRLLPPDWRPIIRNVLDAYNGGTVAGNSGYNPGKVISSVKAAILATPGKFVLSGLSQGTIVVAYILNELRFGQLQSRFSDLLGVYNFGDVCRPSGWSVPLHGAFDPGGAGALTQPWVQSYGNSTGLHRPTASPALSPEVYWSFSNLNDAASSAAATAQPLLGRIGHRIMYSTPQSPDRLVLLYGRNGVVNGGDLSGLVNNFGNSIGGLLANLVVTGFTAATIGNWLKIGEQAAAAAGTFAGESMLRLVVDEVTKWRGVGSRPQVGQILTLIQQWFPFALGFLPVNDQTLSSFNPHARYSQPFSYTAMRFNSKGAVQLAFERLHAVGKNFHPHTTPVSSAPASKPYWLLTFGKPGEFFDPTTAGASWPSLTPLGAPPGSAGATWTSYGDTTITYTSDWGRRNTDPQQTGPGAQVFAALPAATKTRVEWVPVSYSSSAFPSVVAARAAVDRAVALILASPAGTKFFLAGHGLGAVVSTLLWDEFATGGRLAARRANLRGVYHYGNPVRPAGAFRSEANPGGEGVAASQSGVRLRPAALAAATVWEFAAPNDPVAVQTSSLSPTSQQAMIRSAFNVCWQNAPRASALQSLITQQARTDLSFVSATAAKDLVLALYSNAPGAHNSYQLFIPRPKASPGKSAITLAVDDITAKAV